jgi:hypothetical protein
MQNAYRLISAVFIAVGALASTACAPVFSDLQGARLVPKGKVEITPSVSHTDSSSSTGSNPVANHFGVQVAGGLNEKVEARGRFEVVREAGDRKNKDTAYVAGAGVKLALKKDRLAALLPFGCQFGSGDTICQIQPTLFATQPLHRTLDATLSGKYILTVNGDTNSQFATNFGLAFGPDLAKWAIRPEVGILFKPGEKGHYTQFSLGLSITP